MIKFFRKIRQKLLSENKFSKYLIYAAGEIILVVIGIMIALGINNWNNEKISEDLVEKSLFRMKLDLESDVKSFTSSINYFHLLNERNDSIYNRLIKLSKNDSFSFIPWNVHTPGIIESKNQSYQEMLNTGIFYSIKNKELIESISSYYKFIRYYKEQTNFANKKADVSRDDTNLQAFWTLDKRSQSSQKINKDWLYNPNSDVYISLVNFLQDSKNATMFKSSIYNSGLVKAKELLEKINIELSLLSTDK